jgi:group I intron endonuclease
MIRNTETGKIYIGQTSDVYKRKSKHASDLNQTKHENCDVQLEYILYGSDKFIFEIIEFLGEKTNPLERERFWIQYFNTEWPNGYNCPYEKSEEYENRESKIIIEEIKNIKNNIKIDILGKTKNYKKFIETINNYKRENWNSDEVPVWKSK